MSKQYGLYDRIEFGKYKGRTVDDVILSDPKYLTWAISEGVVELSNEAYEVYNRRVID